VQTQVKRLLDTPAGRRQMGVFAGLWLNTDRIVTSKFDRDTAMFPKYTPKVRSAMAEEVREFYRDVFFGTNTSFERFFDADYTLVNSDLASYYGVSSSATSSSQWVKTGTLDKRGGVLTLGAFMTVNAHADKSSPIQRGVRLREQLLCQHLEPPPELAEDRKKQLDLADAEYAAGIATTRRYYEVITDAPSCDSCHKAIINPTFGTEDFDQVGQWRATQKGSTGRDLAINTAGILYGPERISDLGSKIEFNGAKDLSKKLAKLNSVKTCVIEKNFRFLAGQPLAYSAVDGQAKEALTETQSKDFACTASKAARALEASGNNLRAMVTEIVTQDVMRFRQ
jgi:hypothetical protein